MAFTLSGPFYSDLTIKKSQFLGCVQPAIDRATAQSKVHELRLQHPTATHVCWALLAGGQSAAVDDGEPSGTAGRPMLEVLRHQDLNNVLATVVRYYGGVKLGAGGLVRAYTDAIAQALLQAHKIPQQRMQRLSCLVPYALEGWLRRELEQAHAQLQEVSHHASVELTWQMPEHAAPTLIARLNEGGQGRLAWLSSNA